MRKVIILQGISGAGKSTYFTKVVDSFTDVVMTFKKVSADDYFLKDGKYCFDVTKLGEAHSTCLRSYREGLQGNVSLLVVDNTNTNAVDMAPYVALAQMKDYEVEIHRLECPVDIAVKRNLHGTPRKVIEGMQYNLERFDRFAPRHWPKAIIIPYDEKHDEKKSG